MLNNNNNILLNEECYICKQKNLPRHKYYDQMCRECGEFNYKKRFQKANLSGYTALVTGTRIKVGYQTALMLLRNGASVLATTRFPNDAAKRYASEKDFEKWKDNLNIYGLDLRHIASVEKFINHIINDIRKLDIIINNAAQTVRRPPLFYNHLIKSELIDKNDKPKQIKRLRFPKDAQSKMGKHSQHNDNQLSISSNALISQKYYHDVLSPAELSQIPLIPGDEINGSEYFPKDKFDKDGQQEDRRPFNSWIMQLDDVPLVELLEVFYINVISPFLFNSRLKKLLKQNNKASFIINVSSMEGNFSNADKSTKHPHTNMAKAALNMMTRTSAEDFAEDFIFMNSVDVGWITNEKPYPLEMSKNERKEIMAIDEVDGAARICDPIFIGINKNDFIYGKFLKNYKIYPW